MNDVSFLNRRHQNVHLLYCGCERKEFERNGELIKDRDGVARNNKTPLNEKFNKKDFIAPLSFLFQFEGLRRALVGLNDRGI